MILAHVAPAARIKRTVNIPGYDPKVELVKFRNFHYLTYDEEYHVIDVQKDNKVNNLLLNIYLFYISQCNVLVAREWSTSSTNGNHSVL